MSRQTSVTMNQSPNPEPTPDDPFELFLLVLKQQMISMAQDFKEGAFKERINWSVKLSDCLEILMTSSILDKHEKGILLSVERDIGNLTYAQRNGEKMTFIDMAQKYEDTICAFVKLITLERLMKGEYTAHPEAAKGLANLSFEANCKSASKISKEVNSKGSEQL